MRYRYKGAILSSIHETAYPRFKPDLTQRELEDVYAPSVEDRKFIRHNARTSPAKLYLALMLKTGRTGETEKIVR